MTSFYCYHDANIVHTYKGKRLYPVLAGSPQANEVEGINRRQALAPSVSHVSLCNLWSPREAAALLAFHVGVLSRGSYVAILWIIAPGYLQAKYQQLMSMLT